MPRACYLQCQGHITAGVAFFFCFSRDDYAEIVIYAISILKHFCHVVFICEMVVLTIHMTRIFEFGI